jgi:hypothetical protein
MLRYLPRIAELAQLANNEINRIAFAAGAYFVQRIDNQRRFRPQQCFWIVAIDQLPRCAHRKSPLAAKRSKQSRFAHPGFTKHNERAELSRQKRLINLQDFVFSLVP